MANDSKGNHKAETAKAPEAAKAPDAAPAPQAAKPDWKALVSSWNDKKKAAIAADAELGKLLHEHDKSFNIAGVGIISGAKAKNVERYYVKVGQPDAPEELSL